MDLSAVYQAKAAEYLLAVTYLLIGFPFFAFVLDIDLPGAQYLPGWKRRR
jgi:hypothetical protein